MELSVITTTTDVAILEAALIAPENKSDATKVAAIQARIDALNTQSSKPLLAFSYSNRIQSNRIPNAIVITEVGASAPPSSKQIALGLTQYAVKVKVAGIGLNDEYPVVVTTRKMPVVGQNLSATLSEYRGISYLDFSDRLVVAAVETVSQINEDTELLEAQAKRAKAKAELANAQIGTQILQSELVIKQSLAKQAIASAAAL